MASLRAYRLIDVDMDILAELQTALSDGMSMREQASWAEKVKLLLERATENPYNETPSGAVP